ncbi:unnamed protein product [Orchesella dallaii]|uniref:Tr-type G domain-containing protein n=1 Tax=Orchesella dallaii TaxID=48710 RepID=A0ABP1RKH2_9HEXA
MDSFVSLFDPDTSDESPTSVTLDLLGNAISSVPATDNLSPDTFIQHLPPEPQIGNIEYKLKLVNPTRQRFEHLVTQMKWRLREGQGEAIYEIGVEDSGLLRGLNDEEMSSSLRTLNEMAKRLGATTTVLRRTVIPCLNEPGNKARVVSEVLIRKLPDDSPSIDVRVAVMGNADAGKSTLLGVITQGELDDGRGRARLNMFRHLHEVQSGRTSSISHEIVGFDAQGRVINYQEGSAETICETSSKLVTLIDLAGHAKYLRTTIRGVSGYSPHYIMFVISAVPGFTKITKEHLSLAVALQIPMMIVISKMDLTTEDGLDQILSDVEDHLTDVGCKKTPVRIYSETDVISVAATQPSEEVIPLISLSNVTGEGLSWLSKLMFLLPPGLTAAEREQLEKELPEFQIDETFWIPRVGTILGGLLTQGVIKEKTSMLLGPLDDGSFQPVCVNSIRRHKTPCLMARASQSVSLSLDLEVTRLRKGMVLVSPQSCPKATWLFQADICVVYHATAICKGFQTTVYIGNVRQTAKIEEILSVSRISTNERASVVFRLMKHPEYLKVGSKIVFCNGTSKGFGTVVHLYPFETKTPLSP